MVHKEEIVETKLEPYQIWNSDIVVFNEESVEEPRQTIDCEQGIWESVHMERLVPGTNFRCKKVLRIKGSQQLKLCDLVYRPPT